MKVSEFDIDNMKSNILAVYNSATKDDIVAGIDWYPAARREINRIVSETGLRHATVAGIIAALSPQLRWSVNISAAESVIRGERPRAVLGASVAKANRILLGEHPDSVLSGPKVVSFYHNLLGDDDYVTVDTHAASAATHAALDKSGIRRNIYIRIRMAYENAARELGMAPATVQAIVWVAWRNHFYGRNQAWKLHKLERS